MIEYLDIENSLQNRGVTFDLNEYFFVLAIVLGEQPFMAYAYTIDYEQYKKVKDSEEEADYFASTKPKSEALLQKQHIVQLKNELQFRHKKIIQDAALKLEDIELTSSDVKKVLASFLRDRIDDPSSASVKELVDLLRMYQPYLPDDSMASDFQRHFIQVAQHFNALCTSCNREFEVAKGISCVCPHCGAKYLWSENEKRYYPNPSKL